MKRTGFQARTKPMARAAKIGILGAAAVQRKAPARKAAMKTKQRAVSATDQALWDQFAAYGCIACALDGVRNGFVSIHHIDGRTKPGCHQLVLPLCAGHHQDGTGPDPTMLAIHPWKARFEKKYGTQAELLALMHDLTTTKKAPKP